MTKRASRNNRPLKLSFVDVKKEHDEPPDVVWRLQQAMYGTHDAAAAWGVDKNVEFSWVRVWCEQSDIFSTLWDTWGDSEALSEVEHAMSDH